MRYIFHLSIDHKIGAINMKLYVLSKKECTSICKDFNANADYLVFEVWEDGKIVYKTSGGNVLKAISKEMYRD